jgi:histone-lysine N-methyltransferase MLL3
MFHVQMTEGQVRMFSDRTMAGAWSEIFQSVKKIRNKEMLQFYPDLINASMLFGLQEPAITKIAESLPGVDQMFNYTVSHENSPLLDLPLAVNPTGCARCEPRSKTLSKHRSRPLITQSPRKKMITTNGSAQNEFTPEIISREARRSMHIAL